MASKYKLWVVLGEEENPLGLAWAKTEGGAKKKFEKSTGRTREGIHVSKVEFNSKDYFAFVELL